MPRSGWRSDRTRQVTAGSEHPQAARARTCRERRPRARFVAAVVSRLSARRRSTRQRSPGVARCSGPQERVQRRRCRLARCRSTRRFSKIVALRARVPLARSRRALRRRPRWWVWWTRPGRVLWRCGRHRTAHRDFSTRRRRFLWAAAAIMMASRFGILPFRRSSPLGRR